MREIKNEDIGKMQRKVAELSVRIHKKEIKNLHELSEAIKKELTPDEWNFIATLLITERFLKIQDEQKQRQEKKKANGDMMYG